ncbi:MAG TPA: phosphatase PAP2 family protein [Acidimicrobiales bacterium]|nr:phosphatase PAP2 family protein [Acidimicrobiales bacterium]
MKRARTGWGPPAIPIPAAFGHLDDAADTWFEDHLRGRRLADALMYGASAAGDHGLLWLALAGLQAARRRDGDWKRPLVRATAGLALESIVVNGPVKWLFRRTRPINDLPRPRHLRQPRTSSFPSGHATAAFFGAALLRDDDPLWPLYYAIAVVVAASRVHVKIHHASDVMGGILIGAALGELARKMFPLAKESSERQVG